MAVDFNAIAQAVAARFAAAAITPPTDEDDIALSTEALPDNIVQEPTVLVFPPEITWEYGPSVRKGVAEFPVRFYIYKVRDNPRNATLILKWLNSLYAQLDAQVHLGLSTYVTHAVVRGITPGELEYGGIKYHGIELTAEVHIWEPIPAVA